MLVRFQSVPTLFNDIDSLLGLPFVSYPKNRRFGHSADVAVKDSGDMVTVVAQLPGVAKDDVKVNMNYGILTISAERKQPGLQEHEQWIRNEITYGTIQRSVELPYSVDADKITASLENGILRVELPKHENAKPKQIDIR